MFCNIPKENILDLFYHVGAKRNFIFVNRRFSGCKKHVVKRSL